MVPLVVAFAMVCERPSRLEIGEDNREKEERQLVSPFLDSNFRFDSLQGMNIWLGGYSNPPLSTPNLSQREGVPGLIRNNLVGRISTA
jgi:hypothetical protein